MTDSDYAGKNTFTLYDLDGDATYITGKGKSALTNHETIFPSGAGEDAYWEIDAGAADDVIDARGSTLDTYLYGGTGNDTIYASTGYWNYIEGGDGNDFIDARMAGTAFGGPSGNGTLLGGAGADTIYGGGGEDFIDGGAGRDTIDAGAGDDWVIYDPNDIRVEGDGGRDTIDASMAAATNVRAGKGVTIDLSSNRDIFFNFEDVIGSKFNDTLTGDNADNFFDGGAGKDTINAGGGNDYVVYDPNDISVDGGFDHDTLTAWDSSVGVNIDLTSTTVRNFEDVEGSRFNDILKGDSNVNWINGNDGDDFIDGGAGYDDIQPGNGNDTWVYDPNDSVWEYCDYWTGNPNAGGIDTIDASGAAAGVVISLLAYDYKGFENVIGSASADELTGNAWDNIIEGGAGADVIDGGGHSNFGDTASYASSVGAVTVDLGAATASGGDAEGDQLTNIQNLVGSQGDDVLTGDATGNVLEGGAGADELDGGGVGEGEMDYASYAGSAAGVTASLADPTANLGDAYGDTYANIAGLIGSAFDDHLIGDDQANFIADGSYFYLNGYLSMGKGDDWIDGGGGNDFIRTGAGNDTVVFDATDTDVADQGTMNEYGYQINTFDTVDASSSAAGVTIDLHSNYSGFEQIIGSGYDDTLTGNDWDNVLVGGAGADSLNGGYGNDTAVYAGSADGVTVDLGAGTGSGGDAAGDFLTDIDNLVGSAHNDVLTGDANNNVIEGGAGADALDGGDGFDTVSYAGSTAAVTVDLGVEIASGGDAAGDTLTAFENVIGSDFGDTLYGTSGDNVIEGGGGADFMSGGGGGIDVYVYKSFSDSVEVQMDTISGFEVGAAGDVLDLSVALWPNGYVNVGFYTTAFDSFDQIKASAEQQFSYGADIIVGTDGTDAYVFVNSPDDYAIIDGAPGALSNGSDMVIELVGVNDVSSLSANNFYTDGEAWMQNLG